ncbi:MAG: Flp pilus assembly protein CpaB [Acidobacteriaceae bacterium]|nr:Flp pilus assembly protein CpaB [Acidobacteriaceae bacterium]MBV9296603.1 Flp pilus assembly protein CpaB [Acidobacteriaceae bacterium]MBV9764439.1 Flp pilus assembly protein CpaB [Acidobacteriaceae bacterium]
MNRRLVAVFAFALLVASATSFMIYRLIVLRVQAPAKALATTKLVVAAHDLQVGALIHDTDLSEVAWGGTVPDQAIKNQRDVIGRGVVAPIFRNEPILDQRLAPKGAGAGLAATIPVGMRAVALRVNDVVGLAGFVLPGMRVDVLIAGTVPGGDTSRTGTLCRTVLQNIEVLSAGQRIEKNVEGKPESVQVVNLLVTPDQAEILNLASDETKVQLVLRNPLDTNEETTHGTSIAGLFNQPEVRSAAPALMPRLPRMTPRPAVAARVASDTTTIEVYSGAKKSEERVEIPQEQK